MNDVAAGLGQEVKIVREIEAPRELVWKAWTDPKMLMQWYAPNACTVEVKRIELEVPGALLLCIRSPEGHECCCAGKYFEIVAPEKLVFSLAIANSNGDLVSPVSMGMDPDWPAETKVTLNLESRGTKTVLTLHQTVLESLARRTGAYPSWLQMLDRLADLIAGSSAK
ncbi:MAG: SRPBCC domain-containing protein [Pirellulales bacterium]